MLAVLSSCPICTRLILYNVTSNLSKCTCSWGQAESGGYELVDVYVRERDAALLHYLSARHDILPCHVTAVDPVDPVSA